MDMNVTVIKRGDNLQITGTLKVGREEIPHDVYCRLSADQQGASQVQDMNTTIEAGKQKLLELAQQTLQGIVHHGQEAQQVLGELQLGSTQMLEPSKGKGICCVCQKEFDLHYIGGRTDLCMSHINPRYM